MARRKADRSTEGGERRAETNAVSAYLTALRAPKVPARSRAKLERRRARSLGGPGPAWISDRDHGVFAGGVAMARLVSWARAAWP